MKPYLTQTNKQTKKLGDPILLTSEQLWKQVTTNAGGRGESITIIYCWLRVSTPAVTLEISVEISKRLKTETAMTQLLHSWVYTHRPPCFITEKHVHLCSRLLYSQQQRDTYVYQHEWLMKMWYTYTTQQRRKIQLHTLRRWMEVEIL